MFKVLTNLQSELVTVKADGGQMSVGFSFLTDHNISPDTFQCMFYTILPSNRSSIHKRAKNEQQSIKLELAIKDVLKEMTCNIALIIAVSHNIQTADSACVCNLTIAIIRLQHAL